MIFLAIIIAGEFVLGALFLTLRVETLQNAVYGGILRTVDLFEVIHKKKGEIRRKRHRSIYKEKRIPRISTCYASMDLSR